MWSGRLQPGDKISHDFADHLDASTTNVLAPISIEEVAATHIQRLPPKIAFPSAIASSLSHGRSIEVVILMKRVAGRLSAGDRLREEGMKTFGSLHGRHICLFISKASVGTTGRHQASAAAFRPFLPTLLAIRRLRYCDSPPTSLPTPPTPAVTADFTRLAVSNTRLCGCFVFMCKALASFLGSLPSPVFDLADEKRNFPQDFLHLADLISDI
ncbi:hypothetical protein Cni_G03510 [Canna indica]|uniref:Uncharacterized protein n=1 Tax=Canna indica TaxID=4628 RepID=A0AAQ3JUP6_9LILI|nr:hypothetical protein Cni_G03510 [Canna indica]